MGWNPCRFFTLNTTILHLQDSRAKKISRIIRIMQPGHLILRYPAIVIFLLIIVSASFSTFSYLNLIPNRNWKFIFFGCISTGILTGTIILKLYIGSAASVGLGIPGGLISGAGIYLLLFNLSSCFSGSHSTSPRPLNCRELVTIGSLSAILSHFFEIQSGMALTTTLLYFWVFLALITVTIARPDPAPTKRENGPPLLKPSAWFIPVLNGIIVATMSVYLFKISSTATVYGYLFLVWITTIVMAEFFREVANRRSLFSGGLFIFSYWWLLEQKSGMTLYLMLILLWISAAFLILTISINSKSYPRLDIAKGGNGFVRLVYSTIFILTLAFIYQTNLKILFAEIHYRIAKSTGKVELFRKAIDVSPEVDYYYDTLSDIHWDNGNHKEGIEVLEEARRSNPYNAGHLHKLAKNYRDLKQWDQANRYYELLVSQFAPNTPLYFREWGDLFRAKGDYDLAGQKYELAILSDKRAYSSDAPFQLNYQLLGDFYIDGLNSIPAGAKFYEAALLQGATLSVTQLSVLCEYFYTENRYYDFIRTSRILADLDSANYVLSKRRAEAFQALGDVEGARMAGATALLLAPPEARMSAEEFLKQL